MNDTKNDQNPPQNGPQDQQATPTQEAVEKLVCYLCCADIWYYIYIGFTIFLVVSLNVNGQVFIVLGTNILLAVFTVAGSLICRRNLRADPPDTQKAKCWYGVVLTFLLLFTAFFFVFASLFLVQDDDMGFGRFFGSLSIIIGFPFLVIALLGFWNCGNFKVIEAAIGQNGGKMEQFAGTSPANYEFEN